MGLNQGPLDGKLRRNHGAVQVFAFVCQSFLDSLKMSFFLCATIFPSVQSLFHLFCPERLSLPLGIEHLFAPMIRGR